MKKKIESKHYIYNRDGRVCYYCHKPLHIDKTTMDHYYPKSLGGRLDVYNVVTSCKRCNSYKKSRVPEDWMSVNIGLFAKGVEDEKIKNIHHSKSEHDKLRVLSKDIREVFMDKSYVVFISEAFKLYVKDNKVYKVEKNS